MDANIAIATASTTDMHNGRIKYFLLRFSAGTRDRIYTTIVRVRPAAYFWLGIAPTKPSSAPSARYATTVEFLHRHHNPNPKSKTVTDLVPEYKSLTYSTVMC